MKFSNQELLLMDPVEVYKLRLNGTISKFPRNFLKQDEIVDYGVCNILIKYLIEEILNWSDQEVCKKLSQKIFKEYCLKAMLRNIFNDSPYEALNSAYPNKYKPWELAFSPKDFWNKETAKEATIWMIEKKLGWNSEQICKKLKFSTFKDNGLGGMIIDMFNGGVYEALNNAYPNKYKPWQLSVTPNGFWNKETAKEATIWLIEEKLCWNEKQICKELDRLVFINNGLNGMLNSIFGDSPYEALNSAYPGKYKPWQLSYTPNNFWNKETAKEATIWLIEEKLKWRYKDVCKKLTYKTFKENGLNGMMIIIFRGNVLAALNNAYPGKFTRVKNKLQLVN